MAEKIIMPQGGQDITEGVVVRWLKAEGDPIKKGEVICEVETEKAVFEVESPIDGVLLKIVVSAGEKVPIFSVIGVVGEPGETVDPASLVEVKKEEEKGIDVSEIRKRVERKEAEQTGEIKVSGRARKLAAEKGVDLSLVQGSGPGGRITEKDVFDYLEKREAATAVRAPEPAAAAAPSAPSAMRGKTVPLSKMRKVIARRLQQSKQTIPHFYVTVSVDVTEAMRLREELNQKADEGGKVSINDMIVKAVAVTLEQFPQINCTLQDDSILYLEDINIGIAVALDEGLVVPVLPAADTLSLKGIAKKSKEIVNVAKSGKQAGLTPGTFTVSNMGMLNVENFIAIINPPEAAILAVGSTEKKLLVIDGGIHIRDVMKMTLSVDHRVADGVTASRFINKVKYHLQTPNTLLS